MSVETIRVGVIVLAALLGSGGCVVLVRRILLRHAVLDQPVERSLHQVPVPRGAGLAVLPVLAASWLLLVVTDDAPPQAGAIAGIALLLMALSFYDDLRGLPVSVRFIGHIIAAIIGLQFLPDLPVFQGLLPLWLDHAATVLLWVWFINLYNFMDGIDGITGVETICLGVGFAAVLGDFDGSGGALGLTAAAAAAGFLYLNWHPAKIFMGDSGSVPLGFMLGWLLLSLAASGQWVAALILPLYYLSDATLTLVQRLARGERVWRAHRQHFYQRAVRNNRHDTVAGTVLAAGIVLITLARGSAATPALSLSLAALVTAAVLALFAWRSRAN